MNKKELLHIYKRVSSSVQVESTSLSTQEKSGIELSKKLDMNYQVHNEGGSSSFNDSLVNRPVLSNLLKMMDEGCVKHLFVWNTDRLSRNQITWYTIRQKMVRNDVIPNWYYARDKRDLGLDLARGLVWVISVDGSFSHAGFRGTFAYVNPELDLIILIFAQSRVGGNPGQEFIEVVEASITK